MCPDVVVDYVGTDVWNATAYRVLSVAYKVSASVRNHVAAAKMAHLLWSFDRLLTGFLEEIYTKAESGYKPPEPVTPEQIAAAIQTLRQIHRAVERIYVALKAVGMANRSLIGGPLGSLRLRADDILDLAESLELAVNPDVDSIFEKSLEELKRGQTFDLESIK